MITEEFKIMLIKRKLKMKELAEKMGMPISTLYDRVNNKHDWTYPELLALKKALSLESNEMMSLFPELFTT